MSKLGAFMLFLAAVLVSPTVAADTPNPHDIPTPVAYELLLVSAARNPAELIDAVGLTGKDGAVAASVISEFNFDRQAHIDALNARHETFDQFRRRCDELVATARAQLRAKLTKTGMVKFDTYVEREKSRMQRHVGQRPLAGVDS